MAKFIPDEIIEEIKSRADIVDIINSYLPLKRAGSSYKALCPFHNEKTPSFNVSPSRQMFYCFGCGKGGDVVKFVMEKENVDYPTALRILAERLGINIPEAAAAPGYAAKNRKDRLYKLHEVLAEFYHSNLIEKKVKDVCDYAAEREISPECIQKFQLGAAPDAWDEAMKFLSKAEFSNEELIEAGVIIKNAESGNLYDRFRNRLIFPIFDELGRVVGFSARTVKEEDKEAKYVNSPETPIFKKAKILYGLHKAKDKIREKKSCVLCEGQLDVIAMHNAQIDNAVAPQGTAFTSEQASIIKRFTNKVIICFDGDDAGRKAALRAIEILLSLDMEPYVAIIPPGEDPDSIVRKNGKDAIAKIISEALPFFDFIIKEKIPSDKTLSPWEKDSIAEDIGQFIAKIASPVLRASLASTLAHKLSVPEKIIIQSSHKKREQEIKNQINSGEAQTLTQNQITITPEAKLRKAEETLLEICLAYGNFCRLIAEDLEQEMISSTAVGRAIETAVSMTLNGEWENVIEHLRDRLIEINDPTLAKILANETTFDQNTASKAYKDCVRTIKIYHLNKKIESLQRTFSETQNNEEKNKLLLEISQIKKEILKINKEKI